MSRRFSLKIIKILHEYGVLLEEPDPYTASSKLARPGRRRDTRNHLKFEQQVFKVRVPGLYIHALSGQSTLCIGQFFDCREPPELGMLRQTWEVADDADC